MTDPEITAEAHRLATTCLHTCQAEAEIATALRKAAERPRCETCKHWDDKRIPGPYSPKTGECKKADSLQSQDFATGFCASYSDSTVHTSPDFGCILHEPKETT